MASPPNAQPSHPPAGAPRTDGRPQHPFARSPSWSRSTPPNQAMAAPMSSAAGYASPAPAAASGAPPTAWSQAPAVVSGPRYTAPAQQQSSGFAPSAPKFASSPPSASPMSAPPAASNPGHPNPPSRYAPGSPPTSTPAQNAAPPSQSAFPSAFGHAPAQAAPRAHAPPPSALSNLRQQPNSGPMRRPSNSGPPPSASGAAMTAAAGGQVSSQHKGHKSTASIASTTTTGSRKSSMRRFSNLFSLKKSRRGSTDTTNGSSEPPAPLPSMLNNSSQNGAQNGAPTDSQSPPAKSAPPSAFSHPLNKGAYAARNGSVDSIISRTGLGRGGSVQRQNSIKFAQLPGRRGSVSVPVPSDATPLPTAPPTAIAPSTESVSTNQTSQIGSSALASSATSGSANGQLVPLTPAQLHDFAKKHGYDPQDPNLPMYARLQAAADSAISGQDAGAAGNTELEAKPEPVVVREPTPPPPPRPPSPDPVVAPALARLVATVPNMTHTILRYARSNTGVEDGQEEPDFSDLAKPNSRYSLGAMQSFGLPFRGKRPREQRTFARGLAAVVSTSTPLVLATLVHYLDVDDLVALAATCRTIRATLHSALGQEFVLHRFLGPVGYETWPSQARALHAAVATGAGGASLLSRPRLAGSDADPVPLTAVDVWHYALSCNLRSEYLPLGQLITRHGQQVDRRWIQLAQRTTQAYNRVLARLRAQEHWDPTGAAGRDPQRTGALAPLLEVVYTGPLNKRRSPVVRSSTNISLNGAKSDLIPPLSIDRDVGVSECSICAWEQMGLKRRFAEQRAWEMASKTLASSVRCPIRATDRAPTWRVFVPASNPAGWLEDSELARAEAELSQTGIRGHAGADHLMAEGDVVWDMALGVERNEGKFIYDGTFIRDLSFTFDPVGHLPSWMDAMSYPPGWYQGVIKASAPQRPIVFLDILPYRDELMESLVLAQRVVQGDKYAMNKWIATATATIGPKNSYRLPIGMDDHTSRQMVQQVCRIHPSWYGRLELQVDGTAECLHDLIVRCLGPWVPPNASKTLLQAVLNPHSTVSDRLLPPLRLPPAPQGKGAPSYAFPFYILRNRCKPGHVVLQPVAVAEPPRT